MSIQNLNINFSKIDQNQCNQPQKDIANNQCKFCFLSEKQSNQKLISPCGCTGSIKYVHKQCLEQWITAQNDHNEGPLAMNTRLKGFNYKCKLCQKNITFEKQLCQISQILAIFQWIYMLYYLKKLKYYLCISIIGSLALNYYFGRYLIHNALYILLKVKSFKVVSLIILSGILMVFHQSFIDIKWGQQSLEISIPYFNK